MTPTRRRFVLIDRDGTLVVERHYLSDPDQLELIPGAVQALRRLKELGFGVAVLTNQSGVARGYFDLAMVDRVHRRLVDLLAAEGVTVDGIYVCPHGPEDGCDCRKPLPGLVTQAAAEHGFDPRNAFVVGDKAADIDLARAVGATGILVRTGWGADAEREGACSPATVVDDLPAAAAWIERQAATTPSPPTLSALVVAHNEEQRLAACLDRLSFADEIVVVLDKCTDGSKDIAARYADRLVEGAWALEGDRRNTGIDQCRGEWIVEIDADEHVTLELAEEIRRVVATSPFSYHLIPVDNWVGKRLVRRGWGASFGKAAYVGLFRKGAKRWGNQRVHPRLTLTGNRGPVLQHRLQHHVDRNISDMIRRFDAYSTARAQDLRESGDIGSGLHNARRVISRFWRCYVSGGGWREGGHGFLIAVFAALYPLVSYLKAKYDEE